MIPAHEQQLFELIEQVEGEDEAALVSQLPLDAVVVFTDGACLGNPGPGGWGWATGPTHFESGAEAQTTNQRMELAAVWNALRANPGEVEVVSDSMYVVNCFNDRWWQGWRRRNWKNSKGEPVKNRDIWEPLIEEVVDRRGLGMIRFRWVKGHAGDPMNEFVDELATTAARLGVGTHRP